MRTLTISLLMGLMAGDGGDAELPEPPTPSERVRAARILGDAIEQYEAGERLPAPLQERAGEAATVLGAGSFQGERLRTLVVQSEERVLSSGDVTAMVERLRSIRGDLLFTPTTEASLPEGWPGMTAVGELELKRYPEYRMAQASMNGGGTNVAFFQLFNHIKKHEIPMTAPVQIDYGKNAGELQQATMGFMYERAGQGNAGPDGPVEVVDVPAGMALSIGQRGYDSAERIAAARHRFQTWLQRHEDRYEAVGPLRMMGWNSPFVPRDQRYFEIQQPVRPK